MSVAVLGLVPLPSAALADIEVSTPGEAQVQVVGTEAADVLTVQRIDRTRTVRIEADGAIAASGACRLTGKRSAECVAPPVSLNPIQPELGIVFQGSPVIVRVSLRGGDDNLQFLRSEVIEDTRFKGFGGDGNDRISAAGLRPGASPPGNLAGLDLFGDAGNDVITGGPGVDVLLGDAGRDTLAGGAGNDTLGGGSGDDMLFGGDGDDTLFGGTDDDVLLGATGNDHLLGDFGGDVLSGGSTTGGDRDTVQYQEFVFEFNEATPDPFDGARRLVPRVGVQVKVGDRICTDGGPEDAANGTRPAVPGGIGVTSSCGTQADGVRRDEVLEDVEIVVGSQSPDVLIGDSSDETLVGDVGDDLLEGGGGVDSLLGAAGDDSLLLRDGVVDLGALCGDGTRDRALADLDDPVDGTCELVDRGAPDAPVSTGGAAAPPPAAPPEGDPPPGQTDTEADVVAPNPDRGDPAVASPVTVETPTPAGSPPSGERTGGPGAGGGDDGATAPEARIVSEVVSVDRRGRARVLVTCVYRADACSGKITIRSKRALRRKGRRLAARSVLGKATITVPWGTSETVSVPLRRVARRVLPRRAVRASVELNVRDASAAGEAALSLRLKRTVLLGGR